MKIEKCKSKEEIDKTAAGILIDAVKNKPDIVLGLSTGNSPIGIYGKIIQDHLLNNTSYRKVRTFNLDEYVGLSGSHPQSYRSFMNRVLFRELDIEINNTEVPSGTGDLEEECKNYEARIQKSGGIDIQLLGIGSNGHIAFNEPGTPFDSLTHISDLSQDTIRDNARYFDSMENVPKKAITMGIQSIFNAKKIILIAMGKNKAEAIKRMVNGPITESLPASILQRHSDVRVLLDEEAASLL